MNNFETKELKSDKLYREIKQLIITDQFKQGAPLSERKLCDLLNASRTPIREALRRLSSENFVELTPEYGAFVSRVTYEQVSKIYDIREMLEALSIRLFTDSITEKQMIVLEKMHTDLKKAIAENDFEKGLEIDLHFHDYIISESKNEYLLKMLTPIFEHTRRIIHLTQYTKEWSQESIMQHSKIVNCIIQKDSKQAEEEMRIHARNSKRHQLEQWIK